jgi:hypothetical protein
VTARLAGFARGALRADLALLPATLPCDAHPARGRHRKALRPPHLRAGPDASRVAHCPQLWLLVLWCLAHCASIGISLVVVVSLALISHHHFNIRNSDRWLCDQRDALRNAHGGRTIGAQPCSIAGARGGVRGRAAGGNAAASSTPASDIAIGAECVGRLEDPLEGAQQSLNLVATKYLLHIHEEVCTRRRDSSVTAWLNIIYGRLEHCAPCVGSPGRGVEQDISMNAICANLVSVAESGYRDVVPLRQNIDLPSPLHDGLANGYENPGQNGSFTEHKSSRVLTVRDTHPTRAIAECRKNDPLCRKLWKLSAIFVHCHEILRARCGSPEESCDPGHLQLLPNFFMNLNPELAIAEVSGVVDVQASSALDIVELIDENNLGLVTCESLQRHLPNIPEKICRTRAFYSQSTFNLLREESERFSNLVSLIGDTTRLREREFFLCRAGSRACLHVGW